MEKENESGNALEKFVAQVAKNDLLDNLALFVEVEKEAGELSTKVKLLASKIDVLDGVIKDAFVEKGIQNMNIQGRTVYLFKQIFAGRAGENVSNRMITKALDSLGLGDMVTFNHQSLTGYVREQAKATPEFVDKKGNIVAEPEEILKILPEPLNTLLSVADKVSVRSRKA